MNIFGLNITTKKARLDYIAKHDAEVEALNTEIAVLRNELDDLCDVFPFDMGQKVYDVALKNAKGRYTKTNPSREYSTITEVVVDEKNYFGLVKRLKRLDVFFSREDAEAYLEHVCK